MLRKIPSMVRYAALTKTKRAMWRLGLEVKRRRNELDDENVLGQVFSALDIDLVVDVGANVGQYGQLVRSCGYTGAVLSFEPLPEAYATLCYRARLESNWSVADRMALGATDGTVIINVAGNSMSSSVLPMLALHELAAPDSGYSGKVEAPLRRLDEVAIAATQGKRAVLLKIDTQGYEDQVLSGASGLMHLVAAVQLELSLAPLYEGQAKSSRIVGLLGEQGFELGYVITGFRDPRTGRLLQMDGIFVRQLPSCRA